ncbi:translation initiation factor IF-2 [Perkinsela sp. CCAP 1560/4]|nr:translation initiation factor IF-2 [Perkinsela sp. CCAP 1560/4]|eukprot:KNH04720.1 translation initiation factor IF-2 [Perkinsela sp. CCAP 1560/4]
MLLEEQKKDRRARLTAIEYTEGDIYVLRSDFVPLSQRPTIVALAGHQHHGKSTIFRVLQGQENVSPEATLSIDTARVQLSDSALSEIKAFGLSCLQKGDQEANCFTIIDTPGHEACWEMRLHGIRTADVIWVPICVEHGVQNQTREVIQIAKELGKKIVILITKIDLQSTHDGCKRAIQGVIDDLCDMDLDPQPICKMKDEKKPANWHTLGEKVPVLCTSSHELRQSSLVFQEAMYHTSNMIRRSHANTQEQSHRGFPQGIILSSYRDQVNGQLACRIIVRNGRFMPGMWFIADFNFGRITKLVDMEGHALSVVSPGSPAILYGLKMNGCPGVGTHIIVVPNREKAKETAAFRAQLQWFVQRFHKLTPLLRPKGMDTSFHHIGNFGQISDDRSIEYKLYYHRAHQPPSTLKRDGYTQTFSRSHGKTPLLSAHSDEVCTKALARSRSDIAQLSDRVDAVKRFAFVLVADSWHTIRLVWHELQRCRTDKVVVIPVGIFVGAFREQAIKTAVDKRADVVFSFRVVCTDAKADFRAQQRQILHKQCKSIEDIVEYTQSEVLKLHRDAHLELESTRTQCFSASFIPDF